MPWMCGEDLCREMNGVSLRLLYGRSWVRFLAGADTKSFVVLGDRLTMSVSAGISNNSCSILLRTLCKAKNSTTFSYKRFTPWRWISVRPQQMELISFRMINGAICSKFEKRFHPT